MLLIERVVAIAARSYEHVMMQIRCMSNLALAFDWSIALRKCIRLRSVLRSNLSIVIASFRENSYCRIQISLHQSIECVMGARGDSNSRPPASKPFELLCQILPEEWLIERIQQVGANSRKLLSPSFVVICLRIAMASTTSLAIPTTVAF
jgi:hypothetical protein